MPSAADQQRLEAIDERVWRQRLQRQLVRLGAEPGRDFNAVPEHQQNGDGSVLLEGGVDGCRNIPRGHSR